MERFVRYKEQDGTKPVAHLDGTASAPLIERALQLPGLLSALEQGLSLSNLAHALNTGRGSMHRLLKILDHF